MPRHWIYQAMPKTVPKTTVACSFHGTTKDKTVLNYGFYY